jgi:hypothetical protein
VAKASLDKEDHVIIGETARRRQRHDSEEDFQAIQEARQKQEEEEDKRLALKKYTLAYVAVFDGEAPFEQDSKLVAVCGAGTWSYATAHTRVQDKADLHAKNHGIPCYKLEPEAVIIWRGQKSDQKLVSKLRNDLDWLLNVVPRIKECFRSRPEKQEVLVRVTFSYSRVESDILPPHLKDPPPPEKPPSAAMIKAKTAEEKVTRKAKAAELLKTNEVETAKKIVDLHKCKEPRYTNRGKGECIPNGNKHLKLNQDDINIWVKEVTLGQCSVTVPSEYVKRRCQSIGLGGNLLDRRGVLRAEEHAPFGTSTPVSMSTPSPSSTSDPVKTMLDLRLMNMLEDRQRKDEERARERERQRRMDLDQEQERLEVARRKRRATSSIDKGYPRDRSRAYTRLSDADNYILAVPPSSPVRIPFDESVMEDFVEWVIREEGLAPGNTLRGALLGASNVLNEQMFTLRIIQSQKTNAKWWLSIGIPPGVGITLANKAKPCEKYLRTRRSNEEAVGGRFNRAVRGVNGELNLLIPPYTTTWPCGMPAPM